MTTYPQRQRISKRTHASPVVAAPQARSAVTQGCTEARPSMVKFYPINEAGRDFVLGDIHGAYDLVIQGMRQVKFNAQHDRIFSVGDLIDRGPDSHRVIEFLAQPYVHAVRGNHDDDFSSMDLQSMRLLGGVNWNGMDWTVDVSDEKLLLIKDRLAQLPIVIQVQTLRGTVGLVHGDVPAGMDWAAFIQAIEQGDERVIEIALRGRDRLGSGNEDGVMGVGRVFVGHSVQWDGPRQLGNIFAIDTGAVFREIMGDRGSLTMVNMSVQTCALGAAPRAEDGFVQTHPEAGEGLFGQYARDRA